MGNEIFVENSRIDTTNSNNNLIENLPDIRDLKNGGSIEITPRGLKMIFNQQLMINEVKSRYGEVCYNLIIPNISATEVLSIEDRLKQADTILQNQQSNMLQH